MKVPLILLIIAVHETIVISLIDSDPEICPQIVSKKRWGARTPFEVDYVPIPIDYIIIHHTVTPNCITEEDCASMLRNIQTFHMEDLLFHDIGYNFMIGGDGKVYEGAGWHKVGAHTRGYNSRSLGICYIGNFTTQLPPTKQLEAGKRLIQCGVEKKEISKNYKLYAARQLSSTLSPGLRLYREIQDWPHFQSSAPIE